MVETLDPEMHCDLFGTLVRCVALPKQLSHPATECFSAIMPSSQPSSYLEILMARALAQRRRLVYLGCGSFPLSRPCNQFLQPIQIQPPRYQLIPDDKTGCPRDAELSGEGAILVNHSLHFGLIMSASNRFALRPRRIVKSEEWIGKAS